MNETQDPVLPDNSGLHNLHDFLNRRIAGPKLNQKSKTEQKKSNKPGTAKNRAKNRKANKLARKQRSK